MLEVSHYSQGRTAGRAPSSGHAVPMCMPATPPPRARQCPLEVERLLRFVRAEQVNVWLAISSRRVPATADLTKGGKGPGSYLFPLVLPQWRPVAGTALKSPFEGLA